MTEIINQKEHYNKVIEYDDSRSANMNRLMGLFKEKELIDKQIDETSQDLLNCQNDLETLIDKTVQEWVSDNPYMELYPIYDGKYIDKVYLSRDKREIVLTEMKHSYRPNNRTRKQARAVAECTDVIQTDSVKIQDVDNELLYNMVCEAWNILPGIEGNHELHTKIHNHNYDRYNYDCWHNYD